MKSMALLAFACGVLLTAPAQAAVAGCKGAQACAQATADVAVSARKRTARRSTRKVVRRRAPVPAEAPASGQIYPNRPAWASPMECYTDDGYGRFRACSMGGSPP